MATAAVEAAVPVAVAAMVAEATTAAPDPTMAAKNPAARTAVVQKAVVQKKANAEVATIAAEVTAAVAPKPGAAQTHPPVVRRLTLLTTFIPPSPTANGIRSAAAPRTPQPELSPRTTPAPPTATSILSAGPESPASVAAVLEAVTTVVALDMAAAVVGAEAGVGEVDGAGVSALASDPSGDLGLSAGVPGTTLTGIRRTGTDQVMVLTATTDMTATATTGRTILRIAMTRPTNPRTTFIPPGQAPAMTRLRPEMIQLLPSA